MSQNMFKYNQLFEYFGFDGDDDEQTETHRANRYHFDSYEKKMNKKGPK